MMLNQSRYHVAAVVGAAVFVLSAHVSPAAAQTPTRHAATCTLQLQVGEWGKSCVMTVPAGKVFIIESATAYSPGVRNGQRVIVTLITKSFWYGNQVHAVVAGSPSVSDTSAVWTGAIPGTIFSDGGLSDASEISFHVERYGSSLGTPTFRVTLTGRLEDM